ncbi:M20 family metallo-hydrolase [Alkalibacillus silvisoli]|uniref:Zn-dependent hydrolase n=1 Tax=Alkalibacillus silvisoli TaxID=392823 RepID=A0ABN1A7P4_9BACI
MEEWLKDLLWRLNLVKNMNQPDGFTRLGYTPKEDESIEVFKSEAKRLGLDIHEDAAGNVMARWEGENPDLPAVASGSHLDTVVKGGGYDGLAGVLCALGAVKKLKGDGFTPKHPIEVIAFRSEESARFGISTIGSKAMTGLLDKSIGSVQDFEGISIKEAVSHCGFDWDNFHKAERSEKAIKTFVELHIEQGTHIEDHDKDYGVVRGIATPIRLKVTANGKAGHTGTTPMHKRHDAFVALSPLVEFVNSYTKQLNEKQNTPIVATVSTVDLKPNVMNVIPSTVEVGIDIRSVSDELKQEVAEAIRQKVKKIEGETDVTFDVHELVNNESILLDDELQQSLVKIGELEGLSPHLMDSGAGHDVMNMSVKWPSGLIFIPCEDGLSHHPDEFASLADLEKGVRLLTQYYLETAKGV